MLSAGRHLEFAAISIVGARRSVLARALAYLSIELGNEYPHVAFYCGLDEIVAMKAVTRAGHSETRLRNFDPAGVEVLRFFARSA